MPDSPNKLVQFWQELKRRKVIKVIAMYAATAFIIMEAAEIMLPRLGLPDWTVTFLIILLIVGFPITIILSWIFDVTPEGIKKTEPVEMASEVESPQIPVRRGLRASDVIIAVLLVAVCILLYPKIFKSDKFEDIRDVDGRISIAVMPFQNVTGDTLYEGFGLGLQNLLITRLSNSDELSVRQMQTMGEILGGTKQLNYASITPSVASDIALKLEANTVILGNIYKSENKLRITANLLDSRSEEIYKSFEIDGDLEDDFFTITDSLTSLIRNHLEIKVLEQELDKEIHSFGISGSAEAYLYLSKGTKKFWQSDYEAAISYFEHALEIDPNLFAASWSLIPAYMNLGNHIQAVKLVDKLYKQIDQFTYLEQILVKFQKSKYDKNPQESIKYNKLILEENPMFRAMWSQLGEEYLELELYQDAIMAYEKALEIDRKWGGGWEWVAIYVNLGKAFHETGQHNKEKEIYELGLGTLTDHPRIIYRQAVCALSIGDTTVAYEYIAKYKAIREAAGWAEYDINDWIGWIYEEGGYLEMAEKFIRHAYEINSQDAEAMNDLAYFLIDHDINVSEGLELIISALEIEPDKYLFVDTKGWGLYKQGKNNEALVYLKKAWDLSPFYSHGIYLHIQEVEQALASQNQ